MNRLSVRVRVALLAQAALLLAVVATDPAGPRRAAGQQPVPKAPDAAAIRHRLLESYPNRVQARLEQRTRSLQVVPQTTSLRLASLINLTRRWEVGRTITVAFKGGTKERHKEIADVANEWTASANLKFDFGANPQGNYRAWKATDEQFAADIRISFDQLGYYSLVGTDSINPQVTRPGEESLNLQGFDGALPGDWKGVVLHEFGHAIGFEHEHQRAGACDFRFEDDAGYVPTTDQFGQFIVDPQGRRPGLYTVLGGPPNNWPKAVVDFNLRNLPDSDAYDASPTFDKLSIMKYQFPAWMFTAGLTSDCYTDTENVVLSDEDKKGAARVYPRAAAAAAATLDLRQKTLDAALKAKALPAASLKHFEVLNAAGKEARNKIK